LPFSISALNLYNCAGNAEHTNPQNEPLTGAQEDARNICVNASETHSLWRKRSVPDKYFSIQLAETILMGLTINEPDCRLLKSTETLKGGHDAESNRNE